MIIAHGHKNVRSTHRTTTEITKHPALGLNGDCIIAVGADKACADLGVEFRERLKKDNAVLEIKISAGGIEDTITASGSEKLLLTHTEDMVIRKSDYVCPRTLAIGADKASCDLDRRLIEKLKRPEEKATIMLSIGEKKMEDTQPLACLEAADGV